jgi:hypothetical protein
MADPEVTPLGGTPYVTVRPTEPDRFLPWVGKPHRYGLLPADIPLADLKNIRACFVAAGLPQEWADRCVRKAKALGGSITWHATAPNTVAINLKNWGWLFTLVGLHKSKASALVRTFALMGPGLPGTPGGTVMTGVVPPTTFASPT